MIPCACLDQPDLLCLCPPQAAFPQYENPHAKSDYAELADALGLGGATEDEKVIRLINAIEDLKRKVEIPASIKEVIQVRELSQYPGRGGAPGGA